jgi:hypothetical protein
MAVSKRASPPKNPERSAKAFLYERVIHLLSERRKFNEADLLTAPMASRTAGISAVGLMALRISKELSSGMLFSCARGTQASGRFVSRSDSYLESFTTPTICSGGMEEGLSESGMWKNLPTGVAFGKKR